MMAKNKVMINLLSIEIVEPQVLQVKRYKDLFESRVF